jgi:hypothetical protein
VPSRSTDKAALTDAELEHNLLAASLFLASDWTSLEMLRQRIPVPGECLNQENFRIFKKIVGAPKQ